MLVCIRSVIKICTNIGMDHEHIVPVRERPRHKTSISFDGWTVAGILSTHLEGCKDIFIQFRELIESSGLQTEAYGAVAPRAVKLSMEINAGVWKKDRFTEK